MSIHCFESSVAQIEMSRHFAQHRAEGQTNGVEQLPQGCQQAEKDAGQGTTHDRHHFAQSQLFVLPVAVAEEDIHAVGAGEEHQHGDEQQQTGGQPRWSCMGKHQHCGDDEQQQRHRCVEPQG